MKREEKLRLLASGLLEGARVAIAKNPRVKTVTINRGALRDLIIDNLFLVDSHIINNWIRLLVVKGLISENTIHRNSSKCDFLINLENCEELL